jgi:tetratricopeptide (TPR) repeat protein
MELASTNRAIMKRLPNLRPWLLVLGLVAAGASTVAQKDDRVVLKNGKEKVVRIKTEDIDGAWYTGTGGAGNTVIRWDEIDTIHYGAADAFDKALETFSGGRINDAATQLEALAGEADLRPPLKQTVLYYLGLANGRLGKPDLATTRFKELLAAFPKSRYLLPVGANLLALHLEKNDAAGAAKDLEPIFAVAKEAGSNEALQAALNVLRGRLLEEQKKYDEAESQYQSSSKVSKADPDVIAAANLGLARCAQKRGRSDAEQRYRDLAKSDASNALLAGAWNGLGDIALEQATKARDTDGMRVALLAYLRGVVMYPPSEGEPSEEYERALAGTARAAKSIAELESNAERKQLFLARAKRSKDQLQNLYPSSRFLQGL